MTKVGIVTDSTNLIPQELIQEYGIQIVPVGFIVDNIVYRDFHDLTMEDFWKMFPKLTKQPTTRAGNPGDFYNTFNGLSKSTESIICIVVSKAMSATFDAANQAAQLVMSEQPGIKIEVIDSKTCQGALGFIALESSRAAIAGKDLNEVIKIAQKLIPKVKYTMVPDAMEYLIRIGRAPKELAQSTQPQVKPILGIVNNTGVMENIGRAETMEEALLKMVDIVGNYIDNSKPVHIMLHYPNRTDECEQLKKLITNRYNCAEIYMTPFTPSMIAAAGPMIGLAFYS